uniref:Protein roadkill n=1 Tax=Aegilops tauschii TaxID=37682 RepID=N1QR22_AEGTA
MAAQRKISAAMVSDQRSFVLKVDGYSRIKELLRNGQFLTSTPFSVGGHNWAVKYYPNGSGKDYADFISLFLFLESAHGEDVKAKYAFSVLDKNGEAVPSMSRTSFPATCFSMKYPSWGYNAFIKKADVEGSVHLKNDCLTIRCDVNVKEIMSEETSVPPSDLHRHLGDLLKDEDAADVTFRVGGQSFYAHRCVLAARSSVFKAELLGAMKESCAASPIEICDMESDVFKSLLHFVYTDSVPVLEMASNKGETDVWFWPDIYWWQLTGYDGE